MYFFQLFIYISIILFSVSCNNQNKDLGGSRNFEFIYQVDLEATNQKVEIWIPIAQTNEVQKITNMYLNSGSLSCEELVETDHFNHYYYCFNDAGLSESMTLSYSFHVQRFEHGTIQYSSLNPEDYDRGTNHMTVPEGDIFSDILLDYNLSPEDIEAVYKYVLNDMHYGKPKSKDNMYYSNPWLSENGLYGKKKVSRDKVVKLYQDSKATGSNYTFGNGNSIYACDIGVGNCTDYHSYFISLLRTMDIPTRFHMGFSISNEDSGKVGGYHCWADFYVKGKGWSPVDISEADKVPEKSDYFFGTVDKNRVELTTGRDLELKNYKKHVNFFIYPLIEGTGFTKRFSYKNI